MEPGDDDTCPPASNASTCAIDEGRGTGFYSHVPRAHPAEEDVEHRPAGDSRLSRWSGGVSATQGARGCRDQGGPLGGSVGRR